MILYDCHMHSSYSGDSDTPPVGQIEEAIRLGLKGICFTDHMDLEFPCPDRAGTDFEFDIEQYVRELSELRDRYADRLDILIGMEAGIRNEQGLTSKLNPRYTELADKYDLDFVIGSTHCLEYTDPYYPDYWKDKDAHTGIRTYFEAVLSNVRSYDCFDASGHFDYLVRYVPPMADWQGIADYRPSEFADIIDEYLRTLIERGIALEYNTAGIKYGLGFAHPHDYVLTRYRELGGELLTIGSDGHRPEHIAYAFKSAGEHLASLGYRYYTVYRARKPEFLALDMT